MFNRDTIRKMDNTREGFKLTPTDKDKRIAELEKENAELRASVESTRRDGVELLSDKRKQLTKAKEYIKLLLMNCVGVYESTGKTIAEIQTEAEQFLREATV